jgi:hypothetical protein
MAKAKKTSRALCALLSSTLLTCLCLGSFAQAEIAQSDNVIVAFHGDISPQRLPRTGTAPIAVQMGAKIKGTDPADPPVLERIVLAINSHGTLQSKGLARCPLAKLSSLSSSKEAQKACADALIGHGNVTSRVILPGQGAFASNGPLLAFNGLHKGKPAIFAQVATGAPLPLTYVIVFDLSKTKGTFGTQLSATLPPIASEYGYISAFDMSLQHRYTHHGQKLSYASAGCPAPAGINLASFPLAKASYEFIGGRTLTQTLQRDCKVRGK